MNRTTYLFGFGIAFLTMVFSCHSKQPYLFVQDYDDNYGIDFINRLEATDSQNIIQNLYFYNGGGVAIGDINNDTLPDIFFTSNQGANKLYLNQGGFQFKDISDNALPKYAESWTTGVTMADVNNDGWLDIYTSCVSNFKDYIGHNRLLINNGDGTFSEKSKEVGLGLQVYGTQAAFFDYDRDGDLDMYMLNHSFKDPSVFQDTSIRRETDARSGDRLFKNRLIEDGKLIYEDVTAFSGIYSSAVGFGLGIAISDINNDGWQDVYIGNDFHENDYLYINNQDGTFTESSNQWIPHGSTFSMGNEISDINNDGLKDIITLDMKPDNYQIYKRSSGIDEFVVYRYKLNFGYSHQYGQNCFFLNNGNNQFSEIANSAGIDATDWSWSVLADDYDLDGQKDIFITNGIVTRPNDLDYLDFISSEVAQNSFSDKELTDPMPTGDWPNYFYKNSGNSRFIDVSKIWAELPADLSSGAAVADLDLDGDLDIVANRINQKALVLQNTATGNYLNILVSPEHGTSFLGSNISLYSGEIYLHKEIKSNRGFMSASQNIAHFGLGDISVVDSIIIEWTNGWKQKIENVSINQNLFIAPLNNHSVREKVSPNILVNTTGIKHIENVYSDLPNQSLLPWSLATEGPALASADVNGDGNVEVFIGNSSGSIDQLYQIDDGAYQLIQNAIPRSSALFESVDAAFFDADNDGDQDLYVVSGGNEHARGNIYYKDQLYINNGSGVFSVDTERLPSLYDNGSRVAVSDFDGDGDQDIFIGTRSISRQYGLEPTSRILINDGQGYFNKIKSIPIDLGLVNDAQWADMNDDGRPDLVVASEWENIQIIFNKKEGFNKSHISRSTGLWRSVAIGDFNNDGVKDIVAGNMGTNLPFQASSDEPLTLFVADFNNNGTTEPILAHYVDNKLYPYENRTKLGSQIPWIKRKFLSHTSFSEASIDDIMKNHPASQLKLKAELLASMAFWGEGGNNYSRDTLPVTVQYTAINDLQVIDFNRDGIDDIVVAGNLFDMAPSLGRLDGLQLSLILGDRTKNLGETKLYTQSARIEQARRITKFGEESILIGFNNARVQKLDFN